MKTRKLLGLVALTTLTSATYAQDWKLGGNTNFGPPAISGLVSNSNYLGSLQNTPIVFGTNGTQRVLIDNGGVGVNTGRVVFGNDLPNNFTPQARLHLHQTGGVVATRFTNDNTGFTANDGLAIGIL
ncbi:MAG: hypothetical protein H6599_06175 [Flavobacteriales bacterium]|nr:hypothetical protein [Flavobacteriales bacterium]